MDSGTEIEHDAKMPSHFPSDGCLGVGHDMAVEGMLPNASRHKDKYPLYQIEQVGLPNEQPDGISKLRGS
ncbi:unnamed protein product [Prunus armeniaca]|uniref:Uncharacterized protein n=1 Tax=Prunus armeniaca TaxID=36596 RepID=A0A6J5THH2_PRUAR|nr:unnamed protein product [Prunus armeniaca]